MIKINFDKYGKIRNLDFGDEVIFKGNNRVNQIFVAFDDVTYNPNHYMTYSALINENDYEGNLTDLATAKTTIDGVEGYTFYLFSNLTAKAGELKLSVRLVDRTTERVLVSGIIPLVIEDTAISTYASVNITKTQYDALLTAFDELSQSVDATNFKTINGESIYGEGDIVVLTGDVMVDYVGQQISDVNDSLWNLSQRISDVESENAELNALIEKQEKKIEQLELASEGNILSTITESDSAYEVDVSVDTLPYATIDKIGGMTYKSNNLLVFDDVPETTKNGITYSVKNGVFYYSGTATARVDINVNLKSELILNGTYTFSMFNNLVNTTVMRLSSGGSVFKSIRLASANIYNTYTFENQTLDGLSFMIESGTSVTSESVSPMLVSGTTAPSKYKQGFIGLRDSKVTEIINKGANLLDFDDVPSTTKNGITYKAENGVIYVNGTNTATSTTFINILLSKQIVVNGTYSNNWFIEKLGGNIDYCRYQDTNGVVVFASDNPSNTQELNTTLKQITISVQASKIVNLIIKPMLVKGTTAPTTFKPYKQPTAIAIPTAIQNLDGYGMGVDSTYYNYVDFENKKFVKMIGSYTFTGSEGFGQANTNTSGVYRYFTEVLKNLAVGVNASNVKGAILMLDLNTATADETYLCKDGVCIDSNGRLYFFKSDAQSATDMANYLKGKTIFFALATPVAEGLSHIIDGEILTEVESGGALTFENEYKQDVPFTWTFQEKL